MDRMSHMQQESATSVFLCKSMREAHVSRRGAFGELSQTDELLIKIIKTALRIFLFCFDYKEGQIQSNRQQELILERQGTQKPQQVSLCSLWQIKRPHCWFLGTLISQLSLTKQIIA